MAHLKYTTLIVDKNDKDVNNDDTFKNNNLSVRDYRLIRGEKGPPGIEGPVGKPGAAGAIGPIGHTGPIGICNCRNSMSMIRIIKCNTSLSLKDRYVVIVSEEILTITLPR